MGYIDFDRKLKMEELMRVKGIDRGLAERIYGALHG